MTVHLVRNRVNPPPVGQDGNMESETPVCDCGWEGYAVYAYNDDMLHQLTRQAGRHLRQANALPANPTTDGGA